MTTTASTLTDAQYLQLAQQALASVESQIDRWLDQDVVDIDTHRTGGLLELTFPNGSKIILNTQPPLHEIWLAARGGGFHYKRDVAAGRWVDTRDCSDLFHSLSQHASAQAGVPLLFTGA